MITYGDSDISRRKDQQEKRSAAPRRGAGRPQPGRARGPEPPGLLFGLLQIVVAALIVARLLVPAEASVHGQTLWLVQLWLAAGLLWGRDVFLRRDFRLRFGAVDLAVWVIVAGHVASALAVFGSGGDRRAAVNMAWEWVGLGVAFFLVRQALRTPQEARRLLLALVATATVLGGLGIWQHYVTYPQIARDYAATRGELDRLEESPPPESPLEAFRRQQRIRTLQSEFTRQQIPLEGPGRALFEDRIYWSREPFGTFGLANTLAGLMAAWLIVTAGLAVNAWRTAGGWPGWAAGGLAMGLIGYCLLLTKSRTAWVGLAAGLAAWGWFALRHRHGAQLPSGSARDSGTGGAADDDAAAHQAEGAARPWLWGGGAAAIVLLLLALAALSGGFDREVVSEAPKSLRYRLEYWTGAWNVVRERPFLGTGPGNFRQHYLKHKLPQSSEEVADPHNFVLDLWTSGGITAVLGMALLIVVAAKLVFAAPNGAPPPTSLHAAGPMETGRPSAPGGGEAGPASNAADEVARSSAGVKPASQEAAGGSLPAGAATEGPDLFLIGAGGGFVLVLAGRLAFGEGMDWSLAALFGGWILAAVCLAKGLGQGRAANVVLGAAGVALVVHLLGAGGIEMPAVTQTLLVLLAVAGCRAAAGEPAADSGHGARGAGSRPGSQGPAPARAGVLAGAVLMLPLFVACFLTALFPVLYRQAHVAAGDVAYSEDGNPARAERLYQEAAARDPLSPEPLERLAELAFARWQSAPRAAEHFERGVRLSREAIERDPFNPNAYRRLGNWHLRRYRQTESPTEAAAAARELARAAERYPASSAIRAELAEASALAGRADDARRHAARALELDRINRAHGHRDRYLPEETVQRLETLSQSGEWLP